MDLERELTLPIGDRNLLPTFSGLSLSTQPVTCYDVEQRCSWSSVLVLGRCPRLVEPGICTSTPARCDESKPGIAAGLSFALRLVRCVTCNVECHCWSRVPLSTCSYPNYGNPILSIRPGQIILFAIHSLAAFIFPTSLSVPHFLSLLFLVESRLLVRNL